MATARVGFGTNFGRACEGFDALSKKRVSDRAIASDNSGSEKGKEDGLRGLWRDCEGEKRERERAQHLCPETENVRR